MFMPLNVACNSKHRPGVVHEESCFPKKVYYYQSLVEKVHVFHVHISR
ncbi:hypothetical protein V6Z11_A12G010500 [Gossypium hirsutum]